MAKDNFKGERETEKTDDIDNIIVLLAEKFQKELALDETTAQVSVKRFSTDDLELRDYNPSENLSSSEQSNISDHSKKSLSDVEATHDTAEVATDQEKIHLPPQNQEGYVRKAGYNPARTGNHIPDHTDDGSEPDNTDDASVPKDDHQINLDYYKLLYRNQPPAIKLPRKVSVWVNMLPEDWLKWKYPITNALLTVNNVAPGLSLKFTKKLETSDISITICTGNCSKTNRSILDPSSECKAKIELAANPVAEELNPIALHELIHALGFEHEHERKDSEHYIIHIQNTNEQQTNEDPQNTAVSTNIVPLTPYDYYSIMHYTVCPENNLKHKDNIDSNGGQPNVQLSELDKVALNFCYRPCITQSYRPRQHDNGMYYCGRQVMSGHNYLNTTNCLEGGPNCPACRVLSRPTHMEKNQWQGRSGWVYCNNNGCGPDCGSPCDNCRKVVTS